MEAYDFAGKTVIPFVTSGGSPMGEAGKNMQALASEATVVDGKRFEADTPGKTLSVWASEWI